MKQIESLQKLGLNQKEQEVYLALLQMEKTTAYQLAKKTNIKRPTVYDILNRLNSRGFVLQSSENNKIIYFAQDPSKLLSIIENQKQVFLSDLPYLNSLYNLKPSKPKISYFEGIEGIKYLYEDTLTSLKKGDEILAYVAEDAVKYFIKYAEEYVLRRVQKGIKLRGIYHDVQKIKQHLEKNKNELRISKTINPNTFPMHNEINIYSNKMIIITYFPEPFGILIESKEVIETQRTIFELAWIGAKSIKK